MREKKKKKENFYSTKGEKVKYIIYSLVGRRILKDHSHKANFFFLIQKLYEIKYISRRRERESERELNT